MFRIEDYIIDYARLNELASHDNDSNANKGTMGVQVFMMPSRSHILQSIKSLKILGESNSKKLTEEHMTPYYKHMINTLIYNRILINVDKEKRENVLSQLIDKK